MAIDYNSGITSLDTGASDITYSGNEGPKSPDQQLMASADPMLVDEYNKYVFELKEIRPEATPISFREFVEQVMSESRQGGAEGGIMRLGYRGGQLVKPGPGRPGYQGGRWDDPGMSPGTPSGGMGGGQPSGGGGGGGGPHYDPVAAVQAQAAQAAAAKANLAREDEARRIEQSQRIANEIAEKQNALENMARDYATDYQDRKVSDAIVSGQGIGDYPTGMPQGSPGQLNPYQEPGIPSTYPTDVHPGTPTPDLSIAQRAKIESVIGAPEGLSPVTTAQADLLAGIQTGDAGAATKFYEENPQLNIGSQRQPGLDISGSEEAKQKLQDDIRDLQAQMKSIGGGDAQDYVDVYEDPSLANVTGGGLGGTGTNVPGTPIVPEGITAAESAQSFQDAKEAEIAKVQAAAAASGAPFKDYYVGGDPTAEQEKFMQEAGAAASMVGREA